MTDGEQEPESEVEMDGVEAAEKRYDEASPENREAAWLELWHARDFTWQGRSEKAALQTEMVEVPASFPDGREAEGEFKRVSLKDYWRWSIGLPGVERLLTDEEMREAGLLVEVDGETYHLIHAPDLWLKVIEHGMPLQILTDIIAARAERVPDDIGTNADNSPNWVRALQLLGGWLPGGLLRQAHTRKAIDMSGAYVPDIHLSGLKVGPLNCLRSLFTGRVNFVGATFSGEADFERATFSGKASFSDATFSGEADFTIATFSGGAQFYNATFSGGAGFEKATFSGEAGFGRATFSREAGFTSATFSGEVDFTSATFSGGASFSSATFSGGVSFWLATFSGGASFWLATFSGGVVFKSATFSGEANFTVATFSGGASFEKATFSGGANFWRTTFSGGADFQKATFSDWAIFENATFKAPVTFVGGTFEDVVIFNKVNWPNLNVPNAFKGARFKDRVDFESNSLISVSAFNEAHFEIPPSFRDLTQSQLDEVFGDSINQTKESIRQAKKAQAEAKRKKGKYEGLTPDQLLAALEGGFRTLKKVADEKGNFLLSQTYYRFEVRTRVKRPEIAFWEKVAATFYGLSSDYGNSIARPFVSLAVILAGFAAIYLALAIEVNLINWQDRAALQSGFFESLDFSLNNVFQPLSALSTDAPREGDASSLAEKLLNNYGLGLGLIVTAISIVQSLTGIVLAFLFGLAVRRRFQIS
ncbi:MAG: hypothetical protein GC205_13410 [Bacteroidetes bacterium]|nr:hypothetical protein [Bacteroidota bacterium]